MFLYEILKKNYIRFIGRMQKLFSADYSRIILYYYTNTNKIKIQFLLNEYQRIKENIKQKILKYYLLSKYEKKGESYAIRQFS